MINFINALQAINRHLLKHDEKGQKNSFLVTFVPQAECDDAYQINMAHDAHVHCPSLNFGRKQICSDCPYRYL